jgi:hypothetical protein
MAALAMLKQSAMMQMSSSSSSMATFLPMPAPRFESESVSKSQLISLSSIKPWKSDDAPKLIATSSRPLHITRLRASAAEMGYEKALVLEGGGNGAGTKGGAGDGGDGDGGGSGSSGFHGDNSWGRSENGGGGGVSPAGGLLGAFLRGWQARVQADPQFAFKVLMEEVIGVGANVLGDMASRPNFGLNELDFVFSTIVVGSILNFTLMYMLAPTTAAGLTSIGAAPHLLPGIFASCPAGHMFEAGKFSFFDRTGTFVYKGMQFAVVGFAAGLVGTALSNVLLSLRKKLDPDFVIQNKSPPTVLNAATWALHMGFSSNLRYQTLNGLEFSLAAQLHPTAFKSAVFALRGLNNVLGGTTFVALARLTGSQTSSKTVESPPTAPEDPPVEDQSLAQAE